MEQAREVSKDFELVGRPTLSHDVALRSPQRVESHRNPERSDDLRPVDYVSKCHDRTSDVARAALRVSNPLSVNLG
jgi:hypothetical protein